jgi:hypothetical protein
LNCGLDQRQLSILASLIENGVNPEALAAVVKELKRETEALKVRQQNILNSLTCERRQRAACDNPENYNRLKINAQQTKCQFVNLFNIKFNLSMLKLSKQINVIKFIIVVFVSPVSFGALVDTDFELLPIILLDVNHALLRHFKPL